MGMLRHIETITERCRKAILMGIGLVKGRYQEYVERQTLEKVPPGRTRRGRLKQRCMHCVNRDRELLGSLKMKSMTELAGGELCLPQ